MSKERFVNRRRVAAVLYWLGILHLVMFVRKWQRDRKPVFIVGHRVLPPVVDRQQDPSGWLALESGQAISVPEFRRRLRFLQRFLNAGDPADLKGGSIGNKVFYLSFDDGYLDNLKHAAPVLEEHKIRAIVFLIGGLLRKPSSVPWWDMLSAGENGGQQAVSVNRYAEVCRERKGVTRGLWRDSDIGYGSPTEGDRLYIGEEELAAGAGRDIFYYGNHTMSHPNLLNLGEAELVEEINGCDDYLSRFPGYLPVFAYPFGFLDDRIKEFIGSKTKIDYAFATGYGRDIDDYDIRRINLNIRPYSLFMAECLGVFDVISGMRHKVL